MRKWDHSLYKKIFSFLYPILAVTAVTGILWYVRDELNIQVISLLYLLPVVFISRIFGLFPAVLTAVLSFFCYNYFFISPRFTLAIRQTQDLISLIVFLIIAIVISQLLNQDRQNLMAVIEREREVTYLYELNIALTGLKDGKEISQILAEKISATFNTDRVEVVIYQSPDRKKKISTVVGDGTPEGTDPDLIIPISTTRGGEEIVRLWRSGLPFSTVEQQMLNTFARQGTLAIERAYLIEIDNHAKILEESDKLKTSLLSSVSHELRTPLATIKAAVSSLRSKTVSLDDASRYELLTAIEEETDRLNHLVGNLLEMSRIESGVLNPQRSWNSMAEIVYGVLKRMIQIRQDYVVDVEIPDDFPYVPVDYIQMDQVFTNLFSNCSKYAPIGSKITVRIRVWDEKQLLIQVKNQSPHIAEDQLERIFDKFYRMNGFENVTGTGLGLSICKGIIEAHGGKIWAQNEPDGLSFYFTVPRFWERSEAITEKEEI